MTLVRCCLFGIGTLLLIVASVHSQCEFSDPASGYSLRWSIDNQDNIVFDLRHKKVGEYWTGVAFGPGMSDLDYLHVEVKNNQVVIEDRTISGYNMGSVDPSNSDIVQIVGTPTIDGGELAVRFKRPLVVQSSTGKSLEVADSGGCYPWNFPTSGGPIGKMHSETPITLEICDLAKCRQTTSPANPPLPPVVQAPQGPSVPGNNNNAQVQGAVELQRVMDTLDQYRDTCTYTRDQYTITYAVMDNKMVFELNHALREPDMAQWTGVGFGEDMSNMNFIEISKYPSDPEASVRDIHIDGYKARNLRSRDTRSMILSTGFSNGALNVVFTRDLDNVDNSINVTSSSCTTWQFPYTGGPIGQEHYRDPKSQQICLSQCGGTGSDTGTGTGGTWADGSSESESHETPGGQASEGGSNNEEDSSNSEE